MDSNLSETFLKSARFLHEKQAFGMRKGEAAVGRQAEVWGRISHGLPFHLLDADARSLF
jgi:hypothetical protein